MKRFGRHFVQRICAHLKDFRCAKDEAMRRLYMKKESSSKSDPVTTRAMCERSFYQRISTSLMGKVTTRAMRERVRMRMCFTREIRKQFPND